MQGRNTPQVRTKNKKTLCGYRASYQGKRALALMSKDKDGKLKCQDYIFLDDLNFELRTGPCLMLEKFISD